MFYFPCAEPGQVALLTFSQGLKRPSAACLVQSLYVTQTFYIFMHKKLLTTKPTIQRNTDRQLKYSSENFIYVGYYFSLNFRSVQGFNLAMNENVLCCLKMYASFRHCHVRSFLALH